VRKENRATSGASPGGVAGTRPRVSVRRAYPQRQTARGQ